jgi:hypothetical protein
MSFMAGSAEATRDRSVSVIDRRALLTFIPHDLSGRN